VIPTIPKSFADIDAKWLSQVLEQQVSGFSSTQIGQGVGVMGDIYRVALDYADANAHPSSVVVKLPSTFEENRSQGVALGMFEAEVRFYNELAHAVDVGLPKVHHANIESGTAEFVIVMEDLHAHRLVEQRTGMSIEEAIAAVRVLASIHAVWWDNAKTSAMEWIPSMVGPRIEFVDQFLPSVFDAFATGFEQYLPQGGLALYEAFVGNYLKINTVLAERSPWTLVHQDYRVENLMFPADPNESVVVIDWQGIGRGPGAYDLAYLLGGSMATEKRRHGETELIIAYHNQLVGEGITGYTLEQCKQDYALAQLMGGLATPILLGGAMDLSNERGVTLVATMASRHVAAALDHNGPALLADII